LTRFRKASWQGEGADRPRFPPAAPGEPLARAADRRRRAGPRHRGAQPVQPRRTMDAFFGLDIPAVIVSKGLDIPAVMIETARERQVALLRSTLKTGELYRRTQLYLEEYFAPSTTVHGSLADVYGVGLLHVGRSGIGKRE